LFEEQYGRLPEIRSSSDATKLYELAISLNEKALTKVSSMSVKHHWETYHSL